MEWLTQFTDLFLHLDKHLNAVIAAYGTGTYLLLFIVVFCETGLVVTPILPGDSLLFAAGTFAASGSLNLGILFGTLAVAAIAGDAVNYAVGYFLGPKVLRDGTSRIFRKEYLDRTQEFYQRYGGKTIVIARFMPIVRTFAPFLAGVGRMSYWRFAAYNVAGAILWIGLCLVGGYLFGGLPFVKKNFTLVILAVVGLSVLPAVFETLRQRRRVPNRA